MDLEIAQEAISFAKDFFQYSLEKRLPGIRLPQEKENSEAKDSKFTENIGKAIMHCWHLNRESFKSQLDDHFCLFSINSSTFMSYAVAYGFGIYDEAKDDVFERFFQMSAFILEMVSYCYERTIVEYMNYKFICWTNIFVQKYSFHFFGKGGWSALQLHSLLGSLLYDRMVESFQLNPNATASKACGLSDLSFAAGSSTLSSDIKAKNKSSKNKRNDEDSKNIPFKSTVDKGDLQFVGGLSFLMENLFLGRNQKFCSTQFTEFHNLQENVKCKPSTQCEESFSFEQSERCVEKSKLDSKYLSEDLCFQYQKTEMQEFSKNSVEKSPHYLKHFPEFATRAKYSQAESTDKKPESRVDEIFSKAKSESYEGKSFLQLGNFSKSMELESKEESKAVSPIQVFKQSQCQSKHTRAITREKKVTAKFLLLQMLNISSISTSENKSPQEASNNLAEELSSASNVPPLKSSETFEKLFDYQKEAFGENEMGASRLDFSSIYNWHKKVHSENIPSCSTCSELPQSNEVLKGGKEENIFSHEHEKSIPSEKENMQCKKIKNIYLENDQKVLKKKKCGVKRAKKQEEINTTVRPESIAQVLENRTKEHKSKSIGDQSDELSEPGITKDMKNLPKVGTCYDSDISYSEEGACKKTVVSDSDALEYPENLKLNIAQLENMFVSDMFNKEMLNSEDSSKTPPDTERVNYGATGGSECLTSDKDLEAPSKHSNYFVIADHLCPAICEDYPFHNKDESYSKWKEVMYERYVDRLRQMYKNYVEKKMAKDFKTSTPTKRVETKLEPRTPPKAPPLATKVSSRTKSEPYSAKECSTSSPSPLKREPVESYSKWKLRAKEATSTSDSQILDSSGQEESEERCASKQKENTMLPKSSKRSRKRCKRKKRVPSQQFFSNNTPRVPPLEPHVFDSSQLETHGIVHKK